MWSAHIARYFSTLDQLWRYLIVCSTDNRHNYSIPASLGLCLSPSTGASFEAGTCLRALSMQC